MKDTQTSKENKKKKNTQQEIELTEILLYL